MTSSPTKPGTPTIPRLDFSKKSPEPHRDIKRLSTEFATKELAVGILSEQKRRETESFAKMDQLMRAQSPDVQKVWNEFRSAYLLGRMPVDIDFGKMPLKSPGSDRRRTTPRRTPRARSQSASAATTESKTSTTPRTPCSPRTGLDDAESKSWATVDALLDPVSPRAGSSSTKL